ncbi:DUF5994 family protein [Actinophytocola sp. NPDC049390]|uniref:DUF5994 family protein n=1 Tax=Actinophytocola sp. NPDC049390 TaxID=3363894 RepID=UPI00378EC7D9
MTSPAPRATRTPAATPAEQSLRLRMKPSTDTTRHAGYVDGGWWPRTRDLSDELPALLAALTDRLGTIERVAYRITEWAPAARRIDNDGRRVKLGGFHHQGANTVDVSGSSGTRVTLLVIPPDTGTRDAEAIARTSATAQNLDTTIALLAITGAR